MVFCGVGLNALDGSGSVGDSGFAEGLVLFILVVYSFRHGLRLYTQRDCESWFAFSYCFFF